MRQIADKIRSFNSFVVTGHERLDGDAVGSELALYNMLKKMGKKVQVANNAKIPDRYLFIPGARDAVDSILKSDNSAECVIAVDCPDASREKILQGHFPAERELLNIDHHASNHLYGTCDWIDPASAAVGEMIFDLAQELGVGLNREISTGLYVSIVTDTGRFGFSCTTERTHRIAAELHRGGIDLPEITRNVYMNQPMGELLLKARAISSLKTENEGRIAYVVINEQDITDCNYRPEESQPLVDIPLMLEGVEVAMYVRQPKAGVIKVSLRSKNSLDVAKLAGQFGGGGHAKAAGCVLKGDLDDCLNRILSAIRGAMENRDSNAS